MYTLVQGEGDYLYMYSMYMLLAKPCSICTVLTSAGSALSTNRVSDLYVCMCMLLCYQCKLIVQGEAKGISSS
jgi:hypothetical protein